MSLPPRGRLLQLLNFMLKNIFKILIIFIIGAVGGIFSDQILWPYFIERPLFLEYGLERRPVHITEKKQIIIQENIALQDAVEENVRAIVGVKTETKVGKILQGSGLIVTADGLAVTLAELVPLGSVFNFFVEGERVGFEILKRDLENNLALIKLDKTGLLTTAFADLEEIRLGERVFLIGAISESGGTWSRQTEKMVNEGIIKNFSQDFIKTNIFEQDNLKGSPLFNIKGEALGINTIESKGEVIAIPITKIREFIEL